MAQFVDQETIKNLKQACKLCRDIDAPDSQYLLIKLVDIENMIGIYEEAVRIIQENLSKYLLEHDYERFAQAVLNVEDGK